MKSNEPIDTFAEGASPHEVRVPVRIGGVYRYPDGDVFVQLLAPNHRLFPLWIGQAEALAIQSVLTRTPMPRPLTADFLADSVRKLGGKVSEVWIYAEADAVCLARARFVRGEDAVWVECRPSDGIAAAVRFDAPVYLSRALLDRFGGAEFPPANWAVESHEEDGQGLQITRVPDSAGTVFTQAAGLLAALAALGWGLWQLSNFCGAPLFLIGLPILRVVVPRFVRPLVRRESWLLAPNSLEVRQSFLRWRWSRSYLGASLSLERGRLGKSPTSLWVTERGRRRKLAEGPEERDLTALGTFVAARTGWPLTGL